MSLVCQALRRRQGRPPVRLFKSHRPGIADGDQRRDFIYVDDAVAVVRWLMETPHGVRHLQCRHRQGAQLPRPDRGDVPRARPRAEDRIHRHAGEHPRPVSVFHAKPRSITCAAPATTPASRRSRTAVRHYVTQVPRHHRPLSLTGADVRFRETALARLGKQTVLCIGDLMLDDFVYGDVSRISPEAPAPVIAVRREDVIVGGAGNVARNIASLGARCIFVGVVGNDEAGRTLQGRARRPQERDHGASRGRSVAADHAQGALRLRASFDPSAARRLGSGQAGRAEDRGGADQARARGAAARPTRWCCRTTPRAC